MRFLMLLFISLVFPPFANAGGPVARIFFQDHDARQVKWADVMEAKDGSVTLGPVALMPGFPKLDAEKQTLVQMRECKGRIAVGVRDNDEGKISSGWILAVTGTKHSDHGDHGHWSYKKPPQVLASKLDTEQGNPAHVYLYDNNFYLANDQKNGYTRLDPEQFSQSTAGEPVVGKPQFIPGGGSHITLATVGNVVGYSAWVDGGGPNKGRVDVSPIGEKSAIKYTFNLPHGGIHGAATAANKIFLAPIDGICWVDADTALSKSKDDVKIHHVSLGKDGEKPLRTGAFATHGNHVFCTTGRGTNGQLVILDASANEPKPTFLKLSGKEGHRALTPEIIAKDGKNPMAFVFQEHDKDAMVADALDVIALDPNGDGKYDDAKVVKTISVGKSEVSGHFGHHAIGFDADRKLAYITNSGEGSISVLNLKSLEIQGTLKVGGKPTHLIVVGGRDGDD
jgi:hypothetical protein